MESPQRPFPWLAPVAAGVLLLLLLASATGWLVRSQCMHVVTPFPWLLALFDDLGIKEIPAAVGGDRRFADRLRAAADRRPQDTAAQIARAALGHTPTAALRADLARSLEDPALCAAVLRSACRDEIRLRRNTAILEGLSKTGGMTTSRFMSDDVPEEPPSAPAHLAAFLRDAGRGERLDPDNAFFPLMRAMSLFAARRDREARDALHRAARKSRFDDYVTVEIEGRWRLLERTGERGSLPHAAQAAAVLLPHASALKNTARVAAAQAVEAERAGRAGEGLAIRRDLLRVGGLVRAGSPSLLVSHVGVSMAAIALTRPGGRAGAVEGSDALEKAALSRALDDFAVFASRTGQVKAGTEARAEITAGLQVLALEDAARNDLPYGRSLATVAGGWLAGLFLLSGAFWMLLFGGAASLAARLPRLREGRSLPRWTWALLPPGLVLLALVAVWQTQAGRGLIALASELAGPTTQCLHGEPNPEKDALEWLGRLWIPLCLVFPLASMLVFSVAGLRSRTPWVVGMARCFRAMAVPVASFLILLYAATVPFTLVMENRAGADLARAARHEGRYLAARRGCAWPGVRPAAAVPMSPAQWQRGTDRPCR